MQQASCQACQAVLPKNQTFVWKEQVFCSPCIEEWLEEQGLQDKKETFKKATRLIDPTICMFCMVDNGEATLPMLAGVPACLRCEHKLRNRPFPRWLVGSMAALGVLILIAFLRNGRFFSGYLKENQATRAFEESDIRKAITLSEAAHALVPESKEFDFDRHFFKGVFALTQDRSAEGYIHFQEAAALDPPSAEDLKPFLLRAQIGKDFDEKNYKGFLNSALELEKLTPDDPLAVGQVASAYAANYAMTGLASFQSEALRRLSSAESMTPPHTEEAKELAELKDRVLWRLESKTILDGDEFYKRFPNGWHGGKH